MRSWSFVGDVEALEEDGGVGFGLVAVLFADDAFELAEADAVLVGHLGLGVDDLALFERGPEGLVAHDDGVDDAEGVELVLVLLEDAELFGADYGALLGVELAGEDLHEGGFAGAVGAGEAVAAIAVEGDRDVLEEELRSVAHGDIGDRDHLLYFLMFRAQTMGYPPPPGFLRKVFRAQGLWLDLMTSKAGARKPRAMERGIAGGGFCQVDAAGFEADDEQRKIFAKHA